MTLRWIVAAVHLLALGIGLGAIFARARALHGPLEGVGLRRVFFADNLWGLAAVLWIVTGVWRAFGGPVATRAAEAIARISYIQTVLIIIMVFAATAMARGFRF